MVELCECGNHVFRNYGAWAVAFVSPDKADLLDKGHADRRLNTVYIRTGTPRQYLHRRVLPGHPAIDHINRNGLDCRDCNLRPTTSAENAINMRDRRGRTLPRHVYLDAKRGKYYYDRDRVGLGEVRIHKYGFLTPQAALAWGASAEKKDG